MWTVALVDHEGRGWGSHFYVDLPTFKDINGYIMLAYKDFLEKFGHRHKAQERVCNAFANGTNYVLLVESIGPILVQWNLRTAEAERRYPYNIIYDRYVAQQTTQQAATQLNANISRLVVDDTRRWFVFKH